MRRLLAIGIAVLLGAIAAPAFAHVDLVSSNPVPGATVTAPQTITLTFSEPPLTLGAAVVLVDVTGVSRPSDVKVTGSTVSAVWPAGLQPGPITARWRVTSDDGHVLQGAVAFSFRPAAGHAASAEPVLGTGSATTAPGAIGPTPAEVDATWWVLGGVLLLTGAALSYLLSARRP